MPAIFSVSASGTLTMTVMYASVGTRDHHHDCRLCRFDIPTPPTCLPAAWEPPPPPPSSAQPPLHPAERAILGRRPLPHDGELLQNPVRGLLDTKPLLGDPLLLHGRGHGDLATTPAGY